MSEINVYMINTADQINKLQMKHARVLKAKLQLTAKVVKHF